MNDAVQAAAPVFSLGWFGDKFGTVAVFSVVFGLIVRGVAAKYGDGYIVKVVERWFASESVREFRKKFVREILDNEIARDDGLIRLAVIGEAEKLSREVIERLEHIQATFDRSVAEQTKIGERLARIEGAVETLRTLKPMPAPPRKTGAAE
jgi:hypothetical protein